MAALDVMQLVEVSAKEYGNKSANLIVMREGIEGIQIPDIYPLSHKVCLAHLDTHYPEWRDKWEAFKEAQGSERGGLAEGAYEILAELRAGIEQAFVAHPLESEEISQYLANHFEPGEVLMVRSTGKEDSAELANPGGNESYAGISADMGLVSIACGRVIASYFSEKSLEQRLKAKQVDDSILGEPFMPVLLQKMIGEVLVEGKETPQKKVYSGVMYVDQAGKVTIQEAPGHGELVVNSKGPTNSYFILGDGTVHQQINEKPFRMVSYINEAGKAELVVQKNTSELRHSSLPKRVVERLGHIGKEIQRFYGDDRDIEFVYDGDQDKLYIVQARPIPLGESARHAPRAISPEDIRTVKGSAPHFKGKTIAVAGSRAEIVNHGDEVIICNTIGDALTMYLDMKDPKIKAVVVARDAPSTSHEAAEFNSVSIPVFYVDKSQKDKIQATLEQGDREFIFDPQRGLIVDWTGKGNPEGVLKDGLFKSPISAERTLLPESAMIFEEPSIRQAEVLLEGAEKEKGMSYDRLLEQLEIIESTTPNTIKESKEALKQVLMDIIDTCRVVHKNDTEMDKALKRNILKHAIAYSLDVDKLLNKIQSSPKSTISTQDQKQLLDLVNGLEALIANPGRKGLYSDSVYNIMQDAALKNRLKEKYPIYARLPEDNRKVVEALFQFGKHAANNELKEKWERFVVQVAMSDRGSQQKNIEKLASLVYFIESNELGSVFINNIYSYLDIGNFSKAIEMLNFYTNQLKPYTDKIFSLGVKAAELEAKATLWGKKKNHARLIKEYEKDITEVLNCIDSFGPLHRLSILAKAKALIEIAKITEIIDTSIKTMKGCQDYPCDDNDTKDEQARLFYRMLSPYHNLMQRMLSQVILKGASLHNMVSLSARAIASSFDEKQSIIIQKNCAVELSASAGFAVNSATIDSAANFERQFIDREKSLEDLFTLFHQNIIASLALIGPEIGLSEKMLPVEVSYINSIIRRRDNVRLISSSVSEGIILFAYNIPLLNHAAKLFISFNPAAQTINIRNEIYGHNFDRRMEIICLYLNMVKECLDLRRPEESDATYSEASYFLSSTYSFDAQARQSIERLLSALRIAAEEMTFNDYHQLFAWDPKLQTINPTKKSEFISKMMSLIRHARASTSLCIIDLINSGINEDWVDDEGKTLLIVAIESNWDKVCSKLIESNTEKINKRDSNGKTPLMIAFEQGNKFASEALIAAGANSDWADERGNTPLMLAIEKSWNRVCLELIQSKTAIDKPDSDGKTPLMIAFERGNSAVSQALIAAGANLDWVDERRNTPLMLAIEKNWNTVCLELIRSKAAIDKPDSHGETPLMIAFERGNSVVSETLINAGANLKWTDKDGKSPLMLAIVMNWNEVCLKLIQSKTAIDEPDSHGKTPLMIAFERDNTVVSKALINAGANLKWTDKDGKSPLMIAFERGDFSMVDTLVKAGASADWTDKDGKTPLIIAIENNWFSVIQALSKDKLLVDKPDRQGKTPLMFSFEQDDYTLSESLIGADVNLDWVDERGNTPLMLAIEKNWNGVCLKLIQSKAAIDKPDSHGKTPLMIAFERGNSVVSEALINAGANLKWTDKDGKTPLMLAIEKNWNGVCLKLIESKAAIDKPDGHGKTPLMIAFERGNTVVSEALINVGANLKWTDKDGKSPLMLAIERRDSRIVDTLVNAGASADWTDKNGKTPLIIAIENNWFSVVQALSKDKLLVDKPDEQGNTPLMLAFEKGDERLCQALIQAGANLDWINENSEDPLRLALNRDWHDICLLIQSKSNLRFTSEQSNALLRTALEENDFSLYENLIRGGADPNWTDESGKTPVILMIENKKLSRRDLLPRCKLLIDLGADINTADQQGKTALMIAIEAGRGRDFIKWLFENEANCNAIDKDNQGIPWYAMEYGLDIRLFKSIIEKVDKSVINLLNSDGKSALMLAIEGDMIEQAIALIQAGANPDGCDQLIEQLGQEDPKGKNKILDALAKQSSESALLTSFTLHKKNEPSQQEKGSSKQEDNSEPPSIKKEKPTQY